MFTTQWFVLKLIYSCQLCLQRAADTRDFLRCRDSFSASKNGPNECGCVRSEDVEEPNPTSLLASSFRPVDISDVNRARTAAEPLTSESVLLLGVVMSESCGNDIRR